MLDKSVPNIIIFGETGAGKSSVVNILDGGNEAKVSSSARGLTFSCERYEKDILGSKFNVFDTVGLNEGTAGTVTAQNTIESLYELIRSLEDGVNLLVYVMRAPRIKSTAQTNYDIFFEKSCRREVPVVLVITGLENEDNMDRWWDNNKRAFDEHMLVFSGCACIMATKGKLGPRGYRYETEFKESKMKLERLIFEIFRKDPWRMPVHSWFTSTALRMRNILGTLLGLEPALLAHELSYALETYGGMTKRQAHARVCKLEKMWNKA